MNHNKIANFKKHFIKGVVGSLGLKIAYTGLTFIISVILARLLSVEGFGTYTYVIAWVNLLRFPATLGLDKVVTREVAIYKTQSNWELMRGLLGWTNKAVLPASIVIALVAMGINWFVIGSDSLMAWAFCIALLTLPLNALRKLRLSAMKGLHKVVQGLAPEFLISPILIVILTGFTYLYLGENLNVLWVLGIRVVVSTITFAIGAIWLRQMLPQGLSHAIPKYKTSEWLRSALPLILFEGMHLVNSRLDIFMLGAIKGVEAVGIYAVINRGVQLIIFILVAVNGVLAPTIASFYAEGKIQKLQKIVTKSSRIVLLISCLVSGTLIGCSYWYLLIFGTEFTQGQNALVILSIGQLFNASTGSVGFLLTMTGHEKYMAFSVAISAIINILLNTWLIPQWGINGAAISTAITMILVNLLNVIWTKNKIGINPTAFGKIN